MSLSTIVNEVHVKEAHRLFQISTLSTASMGFNINCDIPTDMAPEIIRIEEAIRRRLSIGSKTPYTKLVEELMVRFNSQKAVEYAIINMIKRDELTHLETRKIVQRKK